MKTIEPTKTRVRFLDSIAGLADKNRNSMDQRYLKIRAELELRKKRPTDAQISDYIASLKRADGYDDPLLGFSRDWSFKPGEVKKIAPALAEKWEACGLVEILNAEEAPAS